MEVLEKTGKTISTIAILWPVKLIFEKRVATVEVDTLTSPVMDFPKFPAALGIFLRTFGFLKRNPCACNGGHTTSPTQAW